MEVHGVHRGRSKFFFGTLSDGAMNCGHFDLESAPMISTVDFKQMARECLMGKRLFPAALTLLASYVYSPLILSKAHWMCSDPTPEMRNHDPAHEDSFRSTLNSALATISHTKIFIHWYA